MPGNELSDIFNSIPFVTRYWFSGTILLSLLGKIGAINPMRLILIWSKTLYEFEIWRPITAVFYYPINPSTGFHFLVNLYFLYSYSSRLEDGMFLGRTADYVFMLLFSWISLLMVTFLISFRVLLEPMVLTVLYVWSQLNRDVIVQFWFGMQFKAMYFPWVLFVFNFIIRGSVLVELIGIVLGHLYYFFTFQYPQEYGGQTFLKTPNFLYRLFPPTRGFVSGFGQPPRARQPTPTSGRFPGSGRVLGED